MSDVKYWEPKICDEAYLNNLRIEYPEKAELTNEELHDYFNQGLKYKITWDNTKDAYSEYEPLAEAYLKQKEALQKIARRLDAGDRDEYTLRALSQIAKLGLVT